MVFFPNLNELANPTGAVGNPSSRRRRLFIPPSTNFPIFSYGLGDDQRLFLSLDESGSVLDDNSDASSVSSSRSLPSTMNSVHTTETQESFSNWLREEHQRRKPGRDSISEEEELGESLNHSPASMDFANIKPSITSEMKKVGRYSLPLMVTFVLEHLFSVISLMVAGQLGKNELAAVSLGSMTVTITFAVFEGTATALDTLCPQAFGASNYQLMSALVQRCVVLSMIVFIPFGVLWFSSPIFLAYIIRDPEVVQLTATYLRVLIIGGPAYIFFEVAKRFLQAQSIFEAGTGVLILSAPINILLSWVLVWSKPLGMGFIGAPIATVINFWIMAVLLVLYVIFIDGKQCWFGFISLDQLFSQWGIIITLAIPGIVMLESEYMAYEILTLFASYFGTVELAAQSAVSSAASLTYVIPFSVSIASSTRIANFIGASNIEAAKVCTQVAMIGAIAVASLNCLGLLIFKRQIAQLFTTDDEVVELVVGLFSPLVAVIQLFDGIASVANGILRAAGLQKIGGLINFLAYYTFALPLAIILAKFTTLRIAGLWIGIGSGLTLIAITESILIWRIDWDQTVINASILFDDEEDGEE